MHPAMVCAAAGPGGSVATITRRTSPRWERYKSGAPRRRAAMDLKIIIPEWIERGTITVRLTELNPEATAALIETIRDATEQDDERIKVLMDLWDALTAE